MSHSPGNSFSAPNKPVPGDTALKRLQEVCSRPEIVQLTSALGNDADLHLVGGTVRDAFRADLPQPNTDLDMATVLPPEESKARFTSAGIRTVDTGLQHGTLTVVFPEQTIELTTFRVPGPRVGSKYSATITEDLKGRDFTINALAYSCGSQQLIDPFDGRKDLSSNVLRAVGDPEHRFQEDPLRLLRMIRFGPAAKRNVEEATKQAAVKCAALLRNVAVERLGQELYEILMQPAPADAVRALYEIGLLEILLPEAIPSVGFEQNEFHIHDVFEHTLWVLERSTSHPFVRFAALFHDLGKPHTLSVGEDGRRHFYKHEQISAEIAESVLSRLRYGNDFIRSVKTLVSYHMRPLDCGPSGVRRLMRDLDGLLDEWISLKKADSPPVVSEEEVQAQFDHFFALLQAEKERVQGNPFGKLAIGGTDLMQLGLPEGPIIGKIIRALEEQVIEDPEKNTPESLLSLAREMVLKEGFGS